jgi:peptidoglycan/xylan/chitin deacetylase (PgdA/CDA1 family)
VTPLITLTSLAFGAAGVAAFTYLPQYGLRMRQRARLRCVFRDRVALTYDDGPDTRLTPALVDLLADHKVRATFFLVGFRAARHPQVCDQLLAAGHELGCHSYWHKRFGRKPPWVGVRDTQAAYRGMAKWLPHDAPYRPPRGRITGWMWLELMRRGATPVWWSDDAGDTAPTIPDPAAAVERIVRRRGGVILIHGRHDTVERERYTLEFTDRLIRRAQKSGLPIVPLFATLSLSNGRTM